MKKTVTNPNGETVTYDPVRHTYTTSGGERLTSVTKLVSSNFPVFDTPTIAARYAKKHNLKVDDVIRMWQEKGRISREFGTRIHAYADRLVTGDNLVEFPKPLDEKEAYYRDIVKHNIKMLHQEYEVVGSEVIFFSTKYMVAGTADLVIKRKGYPVVCIFDWKTNEEIKRENQWQSGLGELEHLEDCNFNHYSLQLGIYAVLGIEGGYFSSDMQCEKKLVHVSPPDGEWMNCKELEKECRMILEKNVA